MVVYVEHFRDRWHSITWCCIGGRIVLVEAYGETRAAALRAIADRFDEQEQQSKEAANETSL